MPTRREVYILDKWEKQRVLLEEPKISHHSPQTCLFDWKKLKQYLNQYQVVYIKPVVGSGGRGIIRISTIGEEQYRLQAGTRQKHLRSWKQLKRKLKERLKDKGSYMIQQGVDLLTVEGHPVDFRILLLKPRSKWKYMGVMGKQAAPDKMVTNHVQGGKALTLRKSLKKSSMDQRLNHKQMKKGMRRLARNVSQAVSRRYPHVRELGLDVALDKEGKLWVIEANTKPAFRLFRKHHDRTLYPRISREMRSIRSRYRF
ncbi:YheC/YheD family protein [Ammoniphilus sp. CFH 90114]|uniref:YheC/YheD family protein n=1 Tax=Ammoniphilus sp. CFH 90114 TaxID=2493665 RepID=UPI00100E6FA7|nr:YheC/YheD family protein [Ammoniphilus sp. CFH 90114]RXT04567.1 hypothetical protein EIZ39_20345 [Ammoniphilus sp. CFH 90114]